MGLVYGIGIFDKGKFFSKVGGKSTKEYSLWLTMLQRCYSSVYQKRRPSYSGCGVSENFKNFQWFAEWCNSQVGFRAKGYQLDKDIIFKGNKIYSENTCFFVPSKLNSFLTKREADRGEFPIGVYRDRYGKFAAQISCGVGINKHLGYFSKSEDAFLAYKLCKESQAKQLAKEYEGLVHPKVIEALNNYVVEITD